MAAKEEKPGKKVSEKMVEVSGETDSLSAALEQAQPKFMTGHPAGSETDDQLLERKAREKQEEEEKKAKEKPAKEKEDLKEVEEEDLSLKEVRITSKGKEKEEKEEETKPLKHKTLEESEKAYQEAERRMHEATQEAAETRRQVAKLQETMTELLLRQQEGQSEKKKADLQAKIKEIEAAEEKAIEEMLDVARELDPADPSYNKKYTKAMAKVFNEMRENIRGTLKEELKAELKEEVVKEAKSAWKGKDPEEERIFSFANSKAKDLGLDMNASESFDDEGNPIPSADYRLFWKFASEQPGKNLKEQIENTVKEVKRIRGTYQKPLLKHRKEKGEEEERPEEEILGKGGRETPEKKEKTPSPMSISDALAQTQRII